MTPPRDRPSPDLSALADRAIALRRSAMQTRLRLAAQREALEGLAHGLHAARAAAPRLVYQSVSIRKEAVAVSAPVPASFRMETRRHAPSVLHALLPFLVIGGAAYAAHVKMARHLDASAASVPALFSPGRDGLTHVVPPPPPTNGDDRAGEALLLVHEWRPLGSQRTLLELLGGELDRPGLPPTWTVERTGPREYLVRFRDGTVDHAFEADLDAGAVRPVSDSDALFARR